MHPLKEIVKKQKQGIPEGIVSVCSSNRFVIEATLRRAMMVNAYALIESTTNQVNQFGGYSGMKPNDFVNYVHEIADQIKFPLSKLILGGDHLGPLVWSDKDEKEAMALSEGLVKDYVSAGFTKIHIDTSMKLADDPEGILSESVIARRGAMLIKACEETFETSDLKEHPVYIVGSEVPIPGGTVEAETIAVTKPEELDKTILTFRNAFHEYGIIDKWDHIVGIVVQPGVEFSDMEIHEYNSKEAESLSKHVEGLENIVLEGHSTDYQTPLALKEMVRDGIAILKVGPGLTFALRETLYSLESIEKALPSNEVSNFSDTLEAVMMENPNSWIKHYHGDKDLVSFKRKFSFSDRSRYYLDHEQVKASIEVLLNNLKDVEIPYSLLSQYMPRQYQKIRQGLIDNDTHMILMDGIWEALDPYYNAIIPDTIYTIKRHYS